MATEVDMIYVETAARLVKGVAARLLRFPIGGTTMNIKAGNLKLGKGSIEVQTALEADLPVETLAEINAQLAALIAADAALAHFEAPTAEALATYDAAFVESSRRPDAGLTTLDLVYVDNLLLCYTTAPLLPSAGYLESVDVQRTKFTAKRKQLEFHFVVKPSGKELPPKESYPTCSAPDAAVIAALNVPLPKEEKKKPAEGGAAAGAGAGAGAAAPAAPKAKKASAAPAAAAPAAPPAAPVAAVATAGAGGGGAVATAGGDSAGSTDAAVAAAEDGEAHVDPWSVVGGEGGIDYGKLLIRFGCSPITEDLVSRVERLTGKRAHRFLRRGFFYTHRDLEMVLNAYERGEKFYLYTGRGPSSSALHMGHLIPFMFTRYLQEAFNVPLVIQITDDEKFLFKPDLKLEECHEMGYSNAKDIIAVGFDVKKTFIFSDLDYIRELYPTVVSIQKLVTLNQSQGIFGFSDSDNIGKQAFPAVQAAPSFSQCFPVVLGGRKDMFCLIPQAIDQDPYFRMTRDIAPRMGLKKPALIHSKFFSSLQGSKTKMSSSDDSSCILVSDTPDRVRKKVRGAVSGGQDTKELQEKLGANLDVDVAYQYLQFFMEDDAELKRIGDEYKAGRMMTGEVKKILVETLVPMLTELQEARKAVTDETLASFMAVRPLEF